MQSGVLPMYHTRFKESGMNYNKKKNMRPLLKIHGRTLYGHAVWEAWKGGGKSCASPPESYLDICPQHGGGCCQGRALWQSTLFPCWGSGDRGLIRFWKPLFNNKESSDTTLPMWMSKGYKKVNSKKRRLQSFWQVLYYKKSHVVIFDQWCHVILLFCLHGLGFPTCK